MFPKSVLLFSFLMASTLADKTYWIDQSCYTKLGSGTPDSILSDTFLNAKNVNDRLKRTPEQETDFYSAFNQLFKFDPTNLGWETSPEGLVWLDQGSKLGMKSGTPLCCTVSNADELQLCSTISQASQSPSRIQHEHESSLSSASIAIMTTAGQKCLTIQSDLMAWARPTQRSLPRRQSTNMHLMASI